MQVPAASLDAVQQQPLFNTQSGSSLTAVLLWLYACKESLVFSRLGFISVFVASIYLGGWVCCVVSDLCQKTSLTYGGRAGWKEAVQSKEDQLMILKSNVDDDPPPIKIRHGHMNLSPVQYRKETKWRCGLYLKMWVVSEDVGCIWRCGLYLKMWVVSEASH